jgi:hypothetical protein
MGQCHHYTIGKVGDDVSGGIYVKKGTPPPKRIILVFDDVKEVGSEKRS